MRAVEAGTEIRTMTKNIASPWSWEYRKRLFKGVHKKKKSLLWLKNRQRVEDNHTLLGPITIEGT